MPFNYLFFKKIYFWAADLLDKWTKLEFEYFGHIVAYDSFPAMANFTQIAVSQER